MTDVTTKLNEQVAMAHALVLFLNNDVVELFFSIGMALGGLGSAQEDFVLTADMVDEGVAAVDNGLNIVLTSIAAKYGASLDQAADPLDNYAAVSELVNGS